MMRARVEWMQYPGDDRILEILEESGLILSPSIISANLDLNRHHVSSRLSELLEHDLVERTSTGKGHYRITDRGRAYLAGEIDAEELEKGD